MLSWFGCQPDSKQPQKNLEENSAKEEKLPAVILKDTTDCNLLIAMLEKECVASSARLNVPTLEQIILLVPSDRYNLDCNQFMIGNIHVIINHQLVNFTIIKNYKSEKDDPVRMLYLMDYKSRSGYKTMELFYPPSGGIFKMVVKMDGGKAVIDDFFCANF